MIIQPNEVSLFFMHRDIRLYPRVVDRDDGSPLARICNLMYRTYQLTGHINAILEQDYFNDIHRQQ